ncbi:hypothetical protein Esti_004685 [Eimeria stiedai]
MLRPATVTAWRSAASQVALFEGVLIREERKEGNFSVWDPTNRNPVPQEEPQCRGRCGLPLEARESQCHFKGCRTDFELSIDAAFVTPPETKALLPCPSRSPPSSNLFIDTSGKPHHSLQLLMLQGEWGPGASASRLTSGPPPLADPTSSCWVSSPRVSDQLRRRQHGVFRQKSQAQEAGPEGESLGFLRCTYGRGSRVFLLDLRRLLSYSHACMHACKRSAQGEAPRAAEAPAAADESKEELEALRKELECLRKENEQLHRQMQLAEKKAADLDDARSEKQAAAEAAQSPSENKPGDDSAAAPLPRASSSQKQREREAPSPQPASRAACSAAQPQPAAAAEAAAAEAAAAEAGEETPQEEQKESPLPVTAVAASQSLQADEPTRQDIAAAGDTAAAGRQMSASAASPSQAASRQSSTKWLRGLLPGVSSRKEGNASTEPLRSLAGSRSHGRQLSAACMRCQELEKEKADLQEKLQTANAQCLNQSPESHSDKQKNQALVAKALDQHQRAQRARLFYYGRRKGLEMRIAALLDKVYELEMANPSKPCNSVKSAYVVKRSLVFCLCVACRPKPRRLSRASIVRPSISERIDSFEGADFPYLLLQLQEEEGDSRQASQGASSAGRRQTILVPAHFFDEAAARTAQQRAAAAAQPRPTVVLPAYAFDENALRRAQERAAHEQQGRPSIALPPFLFGGEKAGARRDAAFAKRPTVAVPAYVFDEAAARKAFERETGDNVRWPTTAVPPFLFREPRDNPARASTTTLPAEWFADDAADKQQQQQREDDPSRQSTSFPSNVFGTLFRRSREEEEGDPPSCKQQTEAEEGPSPVKDEEHGKRKAEPVVVAAESEDEAIFPDIAKGGARIRPLPKQSSLRASSADAPRQALRATARNTVSPFCQAACVSLSSFLSLSRSRWRTSRSVCCFLPLRLLLCVSVGLSSSLWLFVYLCSSPKAPKPRGEDVFITAPCCGRSTPPTDVRAFKRCGCQVCRKCLKTASMQAKVHLSNFVGSDPKTGSPIWKVRCPSCGLVAPLTTTQLRIASIKRVGAT